MRPVARGWAAGLSVLVAMLQGCEAAPSRASWQRIDLWLNRPVVADENFEPTGSLAPRHELPLGASDVRDPSLLNEWQKKRQGPLSAAAIRAIEQETGSILIATMELGSAPVFTFFPLPDERAPCESEIEVSVRPRGGQDETTVLLSHRVSTALFPPPDPMTVDLGRFSNQRVDLLLGLRGPSGCRAFWGGPAVYSRDDARRRARTKARPNIVLIAVDTLRADALGAYGRSPSVTPAIDHLASESDVWERAYTAFNVTVPSFTSILTGLYGRNHGVYDHATRIPESLVTLQELLSEAGYGTGAFLAARHLAIVGLEAGFDRVVAPANHYSGITTVDEAINWIGLQDDPYFALVHLYDPHTPHVPPGRFAHGYHPDGRFGLGEVTRWKAWREPGPKPFAHEGLGGDVDLYADEVAWTDRQIDRLLDFLRSRDDLENTIIVFVADHGENLEDHGIRYGHGGLWETTVHVPMMIRWPGREREGRRIGGLVQSIDLFPTLLNQADLRPPASDGRDLRELERLGGRPVVFSEHAHGRGEMIRTRGFKYMISRGHMTIAAGPYLYDLDADPEESRNLAGEGHPEEERLARILGDWTSTPGVGAEPVELDDETIQHLRSLGYMQ